MSKEVKHTPEPWFYGSYGELLIVGNYKGEPDKHNVIASLGPQHFPSNTVEYEDAERIVDCVNACAGMENPAAELESLRAENAAQALLIASLKEERDRVLAANKDCILHFETLKLDYDRGTKQLSATKEYAEQLRRAIHLWNERSRQAPNALAAALALPKPWDTIRKSEG